MPTKHTKHTKVFFVFLVYFVGNIDKRCKGSLVKCQRCPRNRESIADCGMRIADLSEPGAVATGFFKSKIGNLKSKIELVGNFARLFGLEPFCDGQKKEKE